MCDEERRRREAVRVEGPWRTFWTLTVPSASVSCGEAWRSVHAWLRRLNLLLRKVAGRRQKMEGYHPPMAYLWQSVAATPCLLPEPICGPFEFAWVVEPHRSGWPHVHMVTTLEWVAFTWLRKEWGKIVGADVRWIRVVPVWSVDGVCRYLTKYMSKATLPNDILAILYRRKLWYCSIKVEPEEPQDWRPLKAVTTTQAWLEAMTGKADERDEGWELECRRSGCYAIWVRFYRWERHMEKDLQESRLVPTTPEERAARIRRMRQESCQDTVDAPERRATKK